VVGSSHEGEEQILIAVYRSLKEKFPQLQMVLAPRHPQRFVDVERLLQAEGVNYDKKSSINGRLNLDRDVLLLDTMGDLQDFYAIADVAFVGGSLVEAGGHNLLEPARFHKPVVFGPHMENFASLASEMKRVGAGVEVTGSEELTAALEDLLANPERCRAFGEKAYSIATDDRAVMQKTLALVEPYLPSERIQ
jgi:3-deoxy-D-manno-octulosonic-acid transferase